MGDQMKHTITMKKTVNIVENIWDYVSAQLEKYNKV